MGKTEEVHGRFVVAQAGGYLGPRWPAGPQGSRTLSLGATGRLVDFMFFEISENLLHVSFCKFSKGKRTSNVATQKAECIGDWAGLTTPPFLGHLAWAL